MTNSEPWQSKRLFMQWHELIRWVTDLRLTDELQMIYREGGMSMTHPMCPTRLDIGNLHKLCSPPIITKTRGGRKGSIRVNNKTYRMRTVWNTLYRLHICPSNSFMPAPSKNSITALYCAPCSWESTKAFSSSTKSSLSWASRWSNQDMLVFASCVTFSSLIYWQLPNNKRISGGKLNWNTTEHNTQFVYSIPHIYSYSPFAFYMFYGIYRHCS